MEITVNTIYGTFIVPQEKTDQLISWLKNNAIRQETQSLREVKIGEYSPEFQARQLLNE